MITKKQVKHIAELARLSLAEKEISKFQKELSSILDFVEKLKQVKLSNVEANFHLVPEISFKKGMRKDEPEKQDAGVIKKLIKTAPKTKDNYIKVKPVF